VNIGDIAHTPGVLALLEAHLPEAEVTLWPSKIDHGVDRLLRARFPNLRIAADAAAVEEAFSRCDFLLHGSGPSLVAEKDVARWREATGKPYGVYGITFAPKSSASTVAASAEALARTVEILNGARFVYFRDSVSLAFAREQGCAAPVMDFSPDGAFACDLRDDAAAETFLAAHGLEPGGFLCCIPRLRFTPYWTIPDKKAAFDPVKHARNEEMKERDGQPLRDAIVAVVRETDRRVLLCPEDRTQMAVGKEMLLDRLPEDVRKRMVWRPDYWLTGEAVSTYVRSAGLFGHEMHSPILCVGHGIPAIVCRWAEQTSKGFMWRDIGLGDWLFDLDREDEAARVAAAVLEMARNPEEARAKAEAARERVRTRFRETMAVVAAAARPEA